MITPDNYKIRPDDKTEPVVASDETSEVKKPKKAANARKEFKEVLSEKKENLENSDLSISDEDTSETAPLMSLFNRPKTKKEENLEMRVKDVSYDEPKTPPLVEKPLVPTEVKLTKAESHLPLPKESIEEKPSSMMEEIDSLAKKGKFNSEYATSQPDIAAIMPNISSTDQVQVQRVNLNVAQKVEQVVPVASPIHNIVVDLIDKLMIVKSAGQTDTVVTLNTPGLFKGTIVVISEFDTANGQLNLAFENLKGEAKILLDSLPNREALLQVLSKEGYTVQQFITTTIIEHPPITADQTGEDQNRRGEQENPEQDKRQR